MINDNELVMNFSRQNELLDYKDFEGKSITIIGAGATGSNLALALAKVGFSQPGYGELKVFDYDDVGSHNLANQYFFPNQVGQQKVNALKDNMAVFDCMITAFDKKVTSDDISCIKEVDADLVILAVDSNDARRDIMENIIPYCAKCFAVIEPGMSLTGNMIKYHPTGIWDNVMERWLKSWVPSSEQKVSACGTTMTAYPTVLGVTHHAMNSIICHHNTHWAKKKRDDINTPLAELDIECYNFKGYYKRSIESKASIIR